MCGLALKPGITLQQAIAEMNTIAAGLKNNIPMSTITSGLASCEYRNSWWVIFGRHCWCCWWR